MKNYFFRCIFLPLTNFLLISFWNILITVRMCVLNRLLSVIWSIVLYRALLKLLIKSRIKFTPVFWFISNVVFLFFLLDILLAIFFLSFLVLFTNFLSLLQIFCYFPFTEKSIFAVSVFTSWNQNICRS